MKKILNIFLAFILLIAILPINSINAKEGNYYYASYTINYRDNNGNVIGTFSKGTKLYLSTQENSNWLRGNYKGQNIYIYKTGVQTSSPWDYYYPKVTVNYRQTPNGKILGTFSRGTKLYMSIDENTNWLKGTYKGHTIYVFRQNTQKTPPKDYYYPKVTVNYRQTPNGKILGTFSKNTKLYLAKSDYPNWLAGTYKGQYIYVYRNNLISTTETSNPAYKITKERQTITEIILNRLIDNYAYTGAKSRVYQNGQNGTRTIVEEVTYINGKESSRKIISDTITKQPKDKIIERYIKTQDKGIKEILVDRTDNFPIYKEIWMYFYNPNLGDRSYKYGGMAAKTMKDTAFFMNLSNVSSSPIEKDEVLLTDGQIEYKYPIAKNEKYIWTMEEAKEYINSLQKYKLTNNLDDVFYLPTDKSLPDETFFISPSYEIITYIMDNIHAVGNYGDLGYMFFPTGKTINYTIENDHSETVEVQEKWEWLK